MAFTRRLNKYVKVLPREKVDNLLNIINQDFEGISFTSNSLIKNDTEVHIVLTYENMLFLSSPIITSPAMSFLCQCIEYKLYFLYFRQHFLQYTRFI